MNAYGAAKFVERARELADRYEAVLVFDEVITQLPSKDLADDLRNRVADKLKIGAPS